MIFIEICTYGISEYTWVDTECWLLLGVSPITMEKVPFLDTGHKVKYSDFDRWSVIVTD